MKKKVVLIRSNPVNPDPPVEKIANTLLESGYTVTIIGWDRSNDYSCKTDVMRFQAGDAKRVLFGIKASFGAGIKGNLFPLIKFQISLYRWLRTHSRNFDIIHSYDFDTAFIAERYAKLHNKCFVYHILDYYIDSHNVSGVLSRIIKFFDNKIIEDADTTIICTEKRIEQIKGSKPRKLYVIHNTPDTKMIDNEVSVIVNKESNRMKIVYVGILAGSRMLKEIAEIVSTNPNMEFHIGGFGKLEEYFANMASVNDNIFYYGKLPYNQTLALEREGDVMVAIYDPKVKNNQFAAPNKFYESLMIGKPLIMAKGTGFDDIIESKNIGVLSEYSYEGIEKSLELVLSRRGEWIEMGRQSNNLYREQYSWNIMKDKIVKIYSEFD